ncbi:MAG TPA: AIPR family protein, partial [Planctomycetota bacterium]|nr:AIPR family protein [Planctomycetota bacterium]
MATADSSSDSLSIKFKVSKEHLRKIEVEPGVLIYHIYPTLADWRGKSVSDAVNPRSHDADAIKGSVPKKIEMTLRDFPQDFYLANRGETLLAESLKFDSENGIVEIFFNDCEGEDAQQGVADGGTTDAVIAAVQDDVADALERKFSQIRSDELPDFLKQSRVHLEVVIGLSERERIARLVEGRNTSKQVKQWTINDFKGGFDWLKKILERPTGPFRGKVGYEENADTAVNVLDVIALLTLFHEAFDKPGKAPTVAYSSKGRLDQKLVDNELGSGYAKLAPLVEDILKLHDHIYVGFNEKYKEVVPTGRLGRYGKTDQRVFLSEPHILPLT